ncbi:putative transcriptional regulator [Mycolicibacter terrae]|uniref:Transcriptional regulator n=1 Tax=Mycolicibacter terrae TaxID=1788 RepID=A0AAD1I024_9MYCO|nr:helix-turn-helix domain-containing protein [Mycolicibacter terrae]ORW96077.1 transcriptional regulator [Mycolicibacter terrae]BBX24018.1 putative transcriptional regulator [Mycolicibacter terrae]SNV57242.1 putative transcriptional regulator [Mycolicibacter terrae]
MEFEPRLRDRTRWSIGEGCSMTKLLNVLSTKTAFLALRECFYGTTRFEDFTERIGASAPAVSRALKQLEAAQIITRVPYQECGKRAHDEYRLTPAGEDLLPVLVALVQWGDKYLQDSGPPLELVAAGTQRRIGVRVTDDLDTPSIEPEDIQIRLPARRRSP